MSKNEDGGDVEVAAEKKIAPASDNPNIKQTTLRQVCIEGLEKNGSQGLWLWMLFLLCLTPNILNGLHLTSYIFLGQMPEKYHCSVKELSQRGYSDSLISKIAVPGNASSCKVYDWDYSQFYNMTHDAAEKYFNTTEKPETISCLQNEDYEMIYEMNDGTPFDHRLSIVPEWELLCERTALRSKVQAALSVGKFVGATLFGILSDKYGRKKSFIIAGLLYMGSGFLTAFTPFYMLLLLGRMGLGTAAAGGKFTSLTLLTENVDSVHRAGMSVAFHFSYPAGMLILALLAYYIHPWRDLQLALSIPAIFLLLHFYFMVESPRWLISKCRHSHAYKMIFGHEPSAEMIALEKEELAKLERAKTPEEKEEVSFCTKLRGSFSELTKLYGPPVLRNRAIICHFVWAVTSLVYYVTALNVSNFKANKIVYVASTGVVDTLGYAGSIVVLKYLGRKNTSFMLYLISGTCLIGILLVPREMSYLIIALSMAARFAITAVYAVLTLHTSELFPTEIRNSALGICSTSSHFGSVLAPYVVDLLGNISWHYPTTVCGFIIMLAGGLTLLHPETRGVKLKDHASEMDEPEEVKPKKGSKSNDMELKA